VSPEVAGLVGLLVLIALILLRMWIGAAMALVGFFGYAYIMGLKPAYAVIAQIPYTTVANYTLTTVPLFILMGEILAKTDIGVDLYDAAYKWVGHLRGGLAMATVFACTLFAAICGVSGPAVVTMGRVAYPEMKKRGYSDGLATGSIVCAGTLAFLIPPSVVFIIYAILTEQSVGKLLMAGILPGILLSFLYILTITIQTAIDPSIAPPGPKVGFRERVRSLKKVWPALALFIIVLGGMYVGVFTPTEAGAIGAFGAMVITALYGRLNLRRLWRALLDATEITGFVFLMIVGAYILMKFLAVSGLTTVLANLVREVGISKYGVLAAIIVLYLILGMFLDVISAVILTMSVIYPLIRSLGFDPIWFGVITVILIEIGLITPPVGLDTYQLSGVTGIPVGTIFRGAIPFLIAALIGVLLIILFPQIALFIPSTM